MSRKKDGIDMRCPNCDYEWKYTGHHTYKCVCPDCRRNIKIEENMVEE